jgi:Fic family protein
MDPQQFGKRAGEVANSKNRAYYTFTPRQLPVEIKVDNEIFRLLEEATLRIGNLNGVGNRLPNPYLLINPFIKKEAVESSRIEGTESSLSDVLLFEAKEKEDTLKGARGDLREVVNFVKATEEGIKRVKRGDGLTLQLLLDLHRMLMEGVRGGDRGSGDTRKVQNWIGRPGSTIVEARYVPPEPEKIQPLLDNLFGFLENNKDLPDLVKIGIAHYQFEAIHPFRDGNGRMGRLLIMLFILRRGILDLPLLYISEYFERYRGTYYDLLLLVSQKGDYEAWLKFFLKATSIQANDASEKAGALLAFIEDNSKAVEDAGGPSGMKIFRNLLSNPYTTVSKAAMATGVAYPTAERAISKLVQVGILKSNNDQKRNRVFVCDRIIKIIQPE